MLSAIVISLVSQGKTYKQAYAEAAEILNRSARACETQWQKHLKSKNKNVKINLETLGKNLLPELGFDEPKKWVQRALKKLKKPTDFIDFESLAKSLEGQLNAAIDIPAELDIVNEVSNVVKVQQIGTEGVVQAIPQTKPAKPVQSKLKMLIKSVAALESENLKVLNSGKGGTDYMVINNEEDFGYLVTTDGEKVTGCNCPHHVHRGAICKHMLKVAMDKNLEVF